LTPKTHCPKVLRLGAEAVARGNAKAVVPALVKVRVMLLVMQGAQDAAQPVKDTAKKLASAAV